MDMVATYATDIRGKETINSLLPNSLLNNSDKDY